MVLLRSNCFSNCSVVETICDVYLDLCFVYVGMSMCISLITSQKCSLHLRIVSQ